MTMNTHGTAQIDNSNGFSIRRTNDKPKRKEHDNEK